MKQVIIILSVLLFCNLSFSQVISYEDSKNWKLYNLSKPEDFNASIELLKQARSVILEDDSMRIFLEKISEIPVGHEPVWMGYYIVSFEKDGIIGKLQVGQYGGYFYDEKFKKYYQLPLELRKDWLNYLSAKASSLRSTIP